jgi:hypothetical protein
LEAQEDTIKIRRSTMSRPTMLALALMALAASVIGSNALEMREGVPVDDGWEASTFLNVSESSGISDPTSGPEAYFWGELASPVLTPATWVCQEANGHA